jgi:CheY-like chemotaxis protein
VVRARAPRNYVPSSGKPDSSRRVKPAPITDTRILVADDNPVNRRLAVIFLKQLGVSVDEVENGEQAVLACQSTRYDLVLMDVHMPIMDGIEATRQIRALENNCNARIPIVALTADAMHEERERFLRSGMDDHIAKPITLQALGSLIDHWQGKEVAHG